jgi:hypothetical protein
LQQRSGYRGRNQGSAVPKKLRRKDDDEYEHDWGKGREKGRKGEGEDEHDGKMDPPSGRLGEEGFPGR